MARKFKRFFRKIIVSQRVLWVPVIFCAIFVNGIDVRPYIDRYCREKERLITTEKLDEYLLVDAEIDTTLLLDCRFCNEANVKEPRVWYRQDRYKKQPEKEVDLGMDNNMSQSRIHTSTQFSLVIKDFRSSDAGIYRCHGVNGEDEEKKFNYRIEAVEKFSHDVEIGKGNISDWENYREINLEPVTNRFAISRMSDLVAIRQAGIILELVSEWTPWGPCERCVRNRGFKASTAQCRLKSRIENQTLHKQSDPHIVKFFSSSPLLACRFFRNANNVFHEYQRSQLLAEEFPSVSRATKDLPEFLLEEKCKNCPRFKKAKKDKFKYKKRYTLAEGAHLAIVCPETTMESQVVWRKDSIVLKKGIGRSLQKNDIEPKVLVDTFSTLYLIDVSIEEEGNYTCYVDDVRMMQAGIRVFSKSRLLSRAFFRHMGYLGFIFLLTSFCYCGGIFVACRERDKFKVKDYREVEND